MRHMFAPCVCSEDSCLFDYSAFQESLLEGLPAAAKALPGHFPDCLYSICWPAQARTTGGALMVRTKHVLSMFLGCCMIVSRPGR